MKKMTKIVALLLVLLVGLVACSSPANNQGGTGAGGGTPTGSGGNDPAPAQLTKVTIGYAGSTCEAATYAAYEKGFFEAEGLDVELVKGDFNFLKDSLATRKVDAVNGLSLAWIKPLEQGLNAKVTAGVHRGCLYVLAKVGSGIETAEDLKGKIIGVPAIGGSQMMIISRHLAEHYGVDIEKDVEWRAYPAAELEAILEKGEVDAIAVGEPFGTQLRVQTDRFVTLLDSSKDYEDEYCCIWLVNGELVKSDPETAAAITRAILAAAEYVENNPDEIGQLLVEKQYVGGTAEVNAEILKGLPFIPSVDGGLEAIKISFEAGKKIGVIPEEADVEALSNNSFVKLPGVE